MFFDWAIAASRMGFGMFDELMGDLRRAYESGLQSAATAGGGVSEPFEVVSKEMSKLHLTLFSRAAKGYDVIVLAHLGPCHVQEVPFMDFRGSCL